MNSKDKTRWIPAYVGLGSNLHGPARQIEVAFDLLGQLAQEKEIIHPFSTGHFLPR